MKGKKKKWDAEGLHHIWAKTDGAMNEEPLSGGGGGEWKSSAVVEGQGTAELPKCET